MNKCGTVESLDVKSYLIGISVPSSGATLSFELVVENEIEKSYRLIPEKSDLKELNALDFINVCFTLFNYPDLDIQSLQYTFLYHNTGMKITHTLYRRVDNAIENYYDQILKNSQILLVKPVT